jgi:hypothetical protein
MPGKERPRVCSPDPFKKLKKPYEFPISRGCTTLMLRWQKTDALLGYDHGPCILTLLFHSVPDLKCRLMVGICLFPGY